MKKPKKPNPKTRSAKKRAAKKQTKRTVKKSVRKAAKRPASRPKKRAAKRNPRKRPSLIRALIPFEDMQALARGAAGDIESLANPRKRIRMRRARLGKRGTGTRKNPHQHLILRRAAR